MGIWLLLIFAGILAGHTNIQVLCQSKHEKKEMFIKRNVLGAEVELAKSLSHREKDSSNLLNVSTTEPWTAKLGFDEAISFWAFSQTHIIANDSIYRLEGNALDSMKLREVALLPEMLLIDGIVFVEVVEWKSILFLMVAFRSDLCKIYTATPTMKITERQKITNVGAKDGEFFVHGNNLFLVVVSSKPEHHDVPSTIYRWTGTHFDIVQIFMTSGAVAVSTFHFKGTVIITVAQYPYDKPAIGSQVFRWANNKLERMQFLPTNGPVALQYMEAYGESYLLVINDYEFSSLFWWTGREFIIWDSFYEVKGMRKISIGYMDDETLILIALKDKIQVYRLLESRLYKLTTVSLFDGEEILSMSLHPNENVKLVAISRKNGALSTSVFNLQLVKGPFGDNRQKMDPLLQCLIRLNDKLLSQEAFVKYLELEYPKILSVKSAVSLKGKLVVNGSVFIKKALLKTMDNTGHMKIISTPQQLTSQLTSIEALVDKAIETIPQLVMKSTPGHITGKLYFHKDLLMDRGTVGGLTVTHLNDKIFDPSNMLRYSSEQKITGTITLNTLKTSKMYSKELNGILLEDLLLNYGDQEISGNHKVGGIKVDNLKIIGKEMINDVKLNSLATKDKMTIRGKKELYALHAKSLKISNFQNVDVTSIGETLVSRRGGDYSLNGLKFHSELIIESLNVTSLNEIHWDSFQEAIFLKGKNQFINGSVWFNTTIVVDDVSANHINKMSPSELMTCSTDQEITSVIKVKVLKANHISAKKCNNLDIAGDVARMGQNNYINGIVLMLDAQVSNVTSEKDAVWVGIPKPNQLHHLLVYEGPLVIHGNLEVDDVELVGSIIQINGSYVDISQLEKEFLMANTKEVTTPTLFAEYGLKITVDLITSKVNGVPIEDMIHIGSATELNALNFANITTSSFDVEPSVTLSGVDIGQLFKSTVMNKGNFVVKGKKSFNGGIIVEDLRTKWIDGHDMTLIVPLNVNGGVLNLGRKIFGKIYIDGHINARNVDKIDYVNNMNLPLLLSHAVRVDLPFELNSVVLSTIAGDNIQLSALNEIDFDCFVKSLGGKPVVINIKEAIINGEIIFSGPLDVSILNDINIYSYLGDVVNKKIGGNLKHKKEFMGRISVKDSLNSKLLNNIDMISLESHHFSKTKPQIVVGYFDMKELSVYNLEVGDINGKPLNYFNVKGSDPQVIHGNITLLDFYLDGDLEVTTLNGCDTGKLGEYLNGNLEIHHLKELNVSKHFTWSENSLLSNSLSHLFSKSVKRNYDTVIDGEITFMNPTYTKLTTTVKGVNGVDLKFIADDCVKKLNEVQVLHGQKIFVSTVNTSKVEVTNNANIKWINGVDIPLINNSLVRKTGFHEIEGHKTFLEGFESHNLQCGGSVGGVSVTNIVSMDADILPSAKVHNLFVSENLVFRTVNSMNLSLFLEGRMTCDGLQKVDSSLIFNGKLILQGRTKTSSINNLYPSETIPLSNELSLEVTGKKTFLQDLFIYGDMDVGSVNGYDLTEEYSLGILANDDVEIEGNVVLASGSIMNSSLEVNYLINGMDLSAIYYNAIALINESIENEESNAGKIQGIVKESFDLCDVTASEFMYLDYGGKDSNEISTSSHSIPSKNRLAVTMNVMDANECNLPKQCLCMKQFHIRVFDDQFTLMPSNGTQRHFTVYDESGERGAELISNTVSRNNECLGKNVTDQYNKVVWLTKDDDTGELTSDFNVETLTFEGYVTDARSFTVESDFYVVVSIYYDAKKYSHNINSLVLKWTDGETEARVMQKIPTYGATVLEILHINSDLYLFIGNSYDSDLRSRDINDEIYRFDAEKEQFILLRSMPTTGTNSAASLSLKGHSFIIKGQDFNAPVVIYKYSEEYNNFYFYQNLYCQGSVLGVGVFYVGGDSMKDGFVAVAATDEKLRIYKYNHVEGFKKVWEQRQKGIQNLKPFTRVQGFIATTGLSGISSLRIVVQGS